MCIRDSVWAGIQRELVLTNAPDAAELAAPSLAAVPSPAPTPVTENASNVVPLEARKRSRSMWGVAAMAAMAGAVVGGAVVSSAIDRGTGGDSPGAETFLAQAVLDPLTDEVPAPGEASVVDSADGEVVRVDARSLPDNEGFYEVWLLDADATKLVALGALPAGSVGTFTVPPGLAIADFPVIDISLESYDGDPSHSKNSLMRGVREA